MASSKGNVNLGRNWNPLGFHNLLLVPVSAFNYPWHIQHRPHAPRHQLVILKGNNVITHGHLDNKGQLSQVFVTSVNDENKFKIGDNADVKLQKGSLLGGFEETDVKLMDQTVSEAERLESAAFVSEDKTEESIRDALSENLELPADQESAEVVYAVQDIPEGVILLDDALGPANLALETELQNSEQAEEMANAEAQQTPVDLSLKELPLQQTSVDTSLRPVPTTGATLDEKLRLAAENSLGVGATSGSLVQLGTAVQTQSQLNVQGLQQSRHKAYSRKRPVWIFKRKAAKSLKGN